MVMSETLFLSFAENRFIWGQYTFCEPSRFLEELDPMYLENSEVLEKTSVSDRFEAYQTFNRPKQFLDSNFRKVSPAGGGQGGGIGTDYKSAPANFRKIETAGAGVRPCHNSTGTAKPKGLMSMTEAKYIPTPPLAGI